MPAVDAEVVMKYSADTGSAEKNVGKLGATLKSLGIAFGAATLIKEIYQVGSAFEHSFAKVQTLMDESFVSTSKLKKGILELSDATGIAAGELTEGLYEALSSDVKITYDGADALEFLTANTKLAIGGFTDMGTAVDVTTTIINAYGLAQSDAMKISNMLIATQNEGKTTVNELGQYMSDVIPMAKAMGVQFDQVGAAISAMTAQGVGTAETMTNLRALFAELGQAGTQASDIFISIAGKTFKEFIESGGTLTEALAMMKDYADQNSLSMADLFSNIRSAQAAMILASDVGADKFSQSLDSLRNSTGLADAAFEEMTNTASYKMTKAFNQMKNVGIELFGALSPMIRLLADILSLAAKAIQSLTSGFEEGTIASKVLAGVILAVIVAVVSYNVYMEAMTAATLASAMANQALNTSMLALAVVAIMLYANVEDMSIGMKILTSVILLVVAVFAVLKVASIITGSTMLAAFAPVLIPILAIIAAIAALVAIISIFISKSDLQKKTEEDTKALKDEREEIDGLVSSMDDASASAQIAADKLMGLSNQAKKGSTNISKMEAEANALNDALGEDIVSVDKSTGAILIYGKAVEDTEKTLNDLIKLKNAEAKVNEFQVKLNDALAKKQNAQLMIQKQQAGEIELTNGEIKAYNDLIKEADKSIQEYTVILDDAIAVQEAERQKIQELEHARGQELMGQTAMNMAKKQLDAERELSLAEHYAKQQELLNNNYVELGLTEEEYINQIAAHQKSIEELTEEHQQKILEATQNYQDTLFGINEKGLYDEAQTVKKLNEIWAKNQQDMANYHSNLQTLSEMGFADLVQVFDDGGVKMGGSLQNVMNGLQGISLAGWKEIQADWEANGGRLSKAMKDKYGNINIQAGLDVLKLSQITQQGYKDAATYAEEEIGVLPISVETTMNDVNDVIVTTGETIAESATAAGSDATSGFVAGAKENMGEVTNAGKLVGTSYGEGILTGLESMREKLKSKARSLASSMNAAFEATLDIHSPSGVGEKAGQFYPLGIARGVDKGAKKAIDSVNNMVDAMMDAGRFSLYNGEKMPSIVYNNEQTINAPYQPVLPRDTSPELQYLDFQRKVRLGFAL